MRKKAAAICLFCPATFLFAAPAPLFGAPASWDLAPADAKILIGVDVRGLRNSSLSDAFPPDMRSQLPLAAFHMPGAELFDDIDSVFLASTGENLAKAAAPGAVPKPGATAVKAGAVPAKIPASFLMVFEGTFPDEHLRPFLKGPHPSYKGVNVYRGLSADPASVAILDEHTVLFGDDKSIYRAIDRKTLGVKAQGALLERARELASSNEVWMVFEDPTGALQQKAGPAALFAGEIEGLDIGVAVRDGLHLDFGLSTKTEAGAEALAQLLATQMQSAVNAKLDGQKAQEFWKNVKMGAAGKRVMLQISMTKEELQENIRLAREQRTSPAGARPPVATAMTGATPAAAPKLALPPPPPKPRSVKIYGLDDGVREIKLDQQK